MKRKYSLTLFIALTLFAMSGASVHAQELSIEEGYGKVRWGASMEEVKKAYKIEEELRVGGGFVSDLRWLISGEDGAIKARQSSFGYGKLCEVLVSYGDGGWSLNRNTAEAVINGIIKKYGSPDADEVDLYGDRKFYWRNSKGQPEITIDYLNPSDDENRMLRVLYENPDLKEQLIQEDIRF